MARFQVRLQGTKEPSGSENGVTMTSDTLPAAAGPSSQVHQLAETEVPEAPGFTLQTIGGIFDEAFDLYKRRFGTLALIVACVFIPTQVLLHAAGNLWLRPLSAATDMANPDPLVLVETAILGLLIGAPQSGVPGYISLLTSFMASGPIAVAVASILAGKPISVGSAYRRAVPVFWRLFWMWNLLCLLIFLTFAVVFIGLCVLFVMLVALLTMNGINANAIGGPEVGAAILFLSIAIPYLSSCALASVLFGFAPPLIGLENLTVMGAVERNTRLVPRSLYWRVYLSLTLLPIVTCGLQIAILASASSVVAALKWPAWSDFVVNTSLASLISFFFQPYWMIFVTLLYFDCRVRREGIDVRYMADNLPELDPYLDPANPLAPGSQSDGLAAAPRSSAAPIAQAAGAERAAP
jgi:hypothetical protein